DGYRSPVVIFWFVLLAMGLGIIFTVISALELCTSSCTAGHKYRLYGFSFETLGMIFFPTLTILHFFSRYYSQFHYIVFASLAVALGAEIKFVYIQKYIIGHWCQICLSIASLVTIAFFASITGLLKNNTNLNNLKGGMMRNAFYVSSSAVLMTIGFFFAQQGFSPFNQLQAAEEALKNELMFGDLQSPIEVYVFTDWKCPACRQIEPIIFETSPKILKQAKLFFIDVIVHDVSLNFLPYNLSFMVHNKPYYFKLRQDLNALSLKTEEPSLEDIQKIAKNNGVKFTPMNFSDLSMANNYFARLTKQFEIISTPTVAIVSKTTLKGKKLNGKEITHQAILKAIDDVKKE
nr:thioredoxin domain-containing protein [Parachlamydiaceae bacterium]